MASVCWGRRRRSKRVRRGRSSEGKARGVGDDNSVSLHVLNWGLVLIRRNSCSFSTRFVFLEFTGIDEADV